MPSTTLEFEVPVFGFKFEFKMKRGRVMRNFRPDEVFLNGALLGVVFLSIGFLARFSGHWL